MARKLKSPVPLDPMRYLKARGSRWHYVRRIPGHASHLDSRGVIQISLKTASLDVAMLRRDALERADDLYWQGLVLDDTDEGAQARYAAAKARSVALGFEYKSLVDITTSSTIEEVVSRVLLAAQLGTTKDREAVLGGAEKPALTVRKAMTFYLDEIGIGETKGMSAAQIASWRKVKLAAAERFCEVVGDKVLLDVTRADAIAFHKWWQARVNDKKGKRGLSGNTANRGFGNLRKLFREYATYLALDVKNPFDGLSFRDPKSLRKIVLPFEADFIAANFLSEGCLKGLNREAKLVFLALVETGCRPSEICNLTAENIHLDAAVPYISIVYRADRKVKTENSVRNVPLVGVSLEALKRAPRGFPRYADRETNLSAVLMKHLREKKLLPTEGHRVYSLRHSYEKRMLEAGMEDEFRRRILGHDTDRPEYGDGGSLEWRRDRMLTIALPFALSLLA